MPAPEDDCCQRIGDRLDCSRDVAREWITFLRALGLVREAERGFVRLPDGDATAIAPGPLGARFRERVHGAAEVIDSLADAEGGLRAETVAERTAGDALTRWEHDRRPDAAGAWAERVGRLLDWAVLFELAERAGSEGGSPRYVAHSSAGGPD